MKKIIIATDNPTYGYKGRLFTNKDGLGQTIEHEVEDEVADEILSMEDTPFREVGASGEAKKSAADVEAEKAAAADLESRTFVTPSAAAAKEEKAEKSKKVVFSKSKTTEAAPAKAAEAPKAVVDPTTEGAVNV